MKYFLVILFLLSSTVGFPASRQPSRGKHAMIASVSPIASKIGVEILQQGGNAIDATVAMELVLAVVWPEAGNLAGGSFFLIRKADGVTEFIDAREVAPKSATPKMYLDPSGRVIAGASVYGYRAAAVPGTIAGLELAHKRHGKLKWEDLVEPARRLAEQGFLVDQALALRFKTFGEPLTLFPESRKIFLKNDRFYQEGELLVQKDLAGTLQQIQKNGPRDFYEGKIANRLIADMTANDGLITMEDLKRYKPVIRKPLQGSYRGFEIVTAPPPSSGGIVLLHMLNIMELHSVSTMDFQSSAHLHLLVETMKRAFALRAGPLGDPAFTSVDTVRFISKEYAKEINETIDLERATPSPGLIPSTTGVKTNGNTTHFSIADREGNIVACTTTLNSLFGSGVTAAETGMLLNNEMDDFNIKPGHANVWGLIQGEENIIEPGKRPLSSMTPSIVLKEGRPFLVLGSPGGPRIINAVFETLMNILDFGMNLQQAIETPRIHHQWLPDEIIYERFGLVADVRKQMEAKGHVFAKDPSDVGDVHAVMIEPDTGIRLGASDVRRGGGTAGY